MKLKLPRKTKEERRVSAPPKITKDLIQRIQIADAIRSQQMQAERPTQTVPTQEQLQLMKELASVPAHLRGTSANPLVNRLAETGIDISDTSLQPYLYPEAESQESHRKLIRSRMAKTSVSRTRNLDDWLSAPATRELGQMPSNKSNANGNSLPPLPLPKEKRRKEKELNDLDVAYKAAESVQSLCSTLYGKKSKEKIPQAIKTFESAVGPLLEKQDCGIEEIPVLVQIFNMHNQVFGHTFPTLGRMPPQLSAVFTSIFRDQIAQGEDTVATVVGIVGFNINDVAVLPSDAVAMFLLFTFWKAYMTFMAIGGLEIVKGK